MNSVYSSFLENKGGIMVIKRLLKKYSIMALGFIFLSIFSSMVFSPIIDNSIAAKEYSRLFSNEEKFLSFSTLDKQYEKDFFKELRNHEGFITQFFINREDINLSGVYFNCETRGDIPLKKGRFFKKEDFLNANNLVVVSEDLEYKIYDENKIKYKGIELQVIGIIDNNKTKGAYKNTLIMDSNNILTYEDINLESYIKIENIRGNIEGKVKSIEGVLREKNQQVFLYLSENEWNENPLMKALDENKFFIIMFIALFFIIFSTIINILSYYLEEEKKNIGIKRALGASKFKIILNTFLEVEGVIITSSILGIAIFSLINSTGYFEWLVVNNTNQYGKIITFILVMLVCIIAGILLLAVIIKKVFSLDINSLIRRN